MRWNQPWQSRRTWPGLQSPRVLSTGIPPPDFRSGQARGWTVTQRSRLVPLTPAPAGADPRSLAPRQVFALRSPASTANPTAPIADCGAALSGKASFAITSVSTGGDAHRRRFLAVREGIPRSTIPAHPPLPRRGHGPDRPATSSPCVLGGRPTVQLQEE